MTAPPLNLPIYPISCRNPSCNETFNLDKAKAEILKSGIVYADCGEVIFQGYKCPDPHCRALRFVRCDRNNPVFDLRDFIITPNSQPFANVAEQINILEQSDNQHEFLRFKIIPAWDEESVNIKDLPPQHSTSHYNRHPSMNGSCFMTVEGFQWRLRKETETGTIELRRLFPDIPKFRNLLTCLAPNIITKVDESGAMRAEDDGSSVKEFEEKNAAWRTLLEEGGGKALNEAIVGQLKGKSIANFDKNEVETLIVQELTDYRRRRAHLLREQAEKAGFEETIWSIFKKSFNDIVYAVCTKLALEPHRKKLTDWVNKAEKGKALFVDAPMGLGKTYSIVEALADNPELSAVIFMPTKKLCEELIFNLKWKIGPKKGYDYWGIISNLEIIEDRNGKIFVDNDGDPCQRFKSYFLNREIYYADGINEDECPFFNEFINRYSYGWFAKNNICEKCEKFLKEETEKIICRFRLHRTRAPLARIIITTHFQYNNFCKQSSLSKWYKYGYYKMVIKGDELVKEKIDGVERNFFIIDEDIILSRFYQPYELKKKQLKGFIATITDFIADLQNNNILNVDSRLMSNINQILAQFEKCDKTSIVPPVDSEFKISHKIKKKWHELYATANQNIPEFIEWSGIVGNYLDFIEHAIKYGFAVQSYNYTFHSKGQSFTKKIKKGYFPNPTAFDLSRLPPHVFFDGTKLGDKFIKHKMKNVELLSHKIDVKLLWQARVFQNVNTDLPKSQMHRYKSDVQRLLTELFNELGRDHKYFIVCSKATEDEYLKDLINENFSEFNIILEHYRNLRGINDAKDCDIAIMLGSFIPPDAVEIAMGLEFIQEQLKPNKILPTENNVWKWIYSNFRMTYNEEYSVIGELAKYLRHSEHRQALARTRYLFHDVDFYIFSKDNVSDYDPYLSNSKTDQFKDHIFPGMPKFKHPESKNEMILDAVIEWISDSGQEIFGRKDIGGKSGIKRLSTVGKHLKHLVVKEILEMASPTKYKLASHLIIKNGNIEPRN